MQRLCYALITLLMISNLSACGSGDAQTLVEGSVSYLLEEATQKDDTEDTAMDSIAEVEETGVSELPIAEKPEADPNVDVDLTILSKTMLYGEVYNIAVNPTPYLDSTIKVSGTYSVYEDTVKDIKYFAVMITDNTGCCAQGFEFLLTDDYVYPDDYPNANDEITVVGELETYEEDGYQFMRLKNATLVE